MKKNTINIVLIIIFLALPILSSPDFDGTFRMLKVPMFQKTFLEMILLIIFFYFNYLYLFPKYFFPKSYNYYILIILGCYLLIAILPNVLISENPPFNRPFNPSFHTENPPLNFKKNKNFLIFFRALLPFSFALLCSLFLRIALQKREAEIQKKKAELLNLRYQLQPHFLFNILNNIYSLSILKSDETPESILKLSNVMRYVVNKSNRDFITLNEEMIYLKDYISLQKIRTDESLDFSFKSEIENENLEIAPMILVNFVENAFKYGFNPEENSEIKILIITKENILKFNIYNKIVIKNISKKVTTKIGIKNTLERLKEIYPNKHQIQIKQTEDDYFVDLKIQLD